MEFEPVIGLEIHAQLLTDAKIFCGCSTKFGAAPNTHTCPVCLGMPGVLPVLNRKVVEFMIRMALATNCGLTQCGWRNGLRRSRSSWFSAKMRYMPRQEHR